MEVITTKNTSTLTQFDRAPDLATNTTGEIIDKFAQRRRYSLNNINASLYEQYHCKAPNKR